MWFPILESPKPTWLESGCMLFKSLHFLLHREKIKKEETGTKKETELTTLRKQPREAGIAERRGGDF